MKTRNGIDLESRKQVGDILDIELTDFLALSYDLKQAHWMVKSKEFKSLHELFDEIHQLIEDSADEIAERMIQIGIPTRGTVQSIAANTSLEKYDEDLRNGMDHVKAILDRVVKLADTVRSTIDQLADLKDPVSADIMTGISGKLDKIEWMLEAHLS